MAISSAQTRERERLKELFQEAGERCLAYPMYSVSFTLDDFHAILDKHGGLESQVGTKVQGTLFMTDDNGALVDIIAKSSAYLPILEASIYNVSHIAEAGIYPGLEDELVVLGENAVDDSLIFCLRSTQCDLAWERCEQLHSEDAVVTVVGQNNGGVVVIMEGLHGSVPFSHISMEINCRRLNKKLALKFVVVNKEQSRLVLSNCKAVAISKAHIGLGLAVTVIVQGLKPYCAFIDIGGIIGLHSILAR